MIKSTNHLAFPSLLIRRAGLLAADQLELLQEQRGRGRTGGPFLFSFLFFFVFRRLGDAGSLSRRLQVLLSVMIEAERVGALFSFGIRDSCLTFCFYFLILCLKTNCHV